MPRGSAATLGARRPRHHPSWVRTCGHCSRRLLPLPQASLFEESGSAWVSPPPWERGSSSSGAAGGDAGGTSGVGGFWAEDEALLPAEARALLSSMRRAEAATEAEAVAVAGVPARVAAQK